MEKINICLRCGKHFSFKSSLKRHWKRKKICENIFLDISYDNMNQNYHMHVDDFYKIYNQCNKISEEMLDDAKLDDDNTKLDDDNTKLDDDDTKLDDDDTKLDNNLICSYCKKKFKKQRYKNKHLKTCKIRIAHINKIKLINNNKKENIIKENVIKELFNEKIDDIKTQVINLIQNHTTQMLVNNVNNTINNNNNNNIFVNTVPYGLENKEMSKEELRKILKSDDIIIQTFINKHLINPENRNLYIKDIKSPNMFVYDKTNQWIPKNIKFMDTVFDDLCYDLSTILSSAIDLSSINGYQEIDENYYMDNDEITKIIMNNNIDEETRKILLKLRQINEIPSLPGGEKQRINSMKYLLYENRDVIKKSYKQGQKMIIE